LNEKAKKYYQRKKATQESSAWISGGGFLPV
jgi:hypothetical protein